MSLMKFLKDEEGQSMVEYGITLGAVAAVSYIAVVMMGDRVADLYAWMANHLPGGEGDDNGQARVDSDGLVGLNEEVGFNDQVEFGARNTDNFTMFATLGSNSAYEELGDGWATDDD